MSALSSDDIRRKEAYILYSQGMSKNKIAQQIGVTRKTILAWSKKENWDEKVAAGVEMSTVPEDQPLVPVSINEADKQFLQEQTINKGLRTLYTLMNQVETAVLNGRDEDIKVNIKTLVDALDKFYRLQMFIEAGGVDKKQLHVKKESIDWTKLIQQSIKTKKEHGENFDEKDFIKNAINAELGKTK